MVRKQALNWLKVSTHRERVGEGPVRAPVLTPAQLGKPWPEPAPSLPPAAQVFAVKGLLPGHGGWGRRGTRGEASLPLSEVPLLNQTIQSRWKRVGSWEGKRRRSRR